MGGPHLLSARNASKSRASAFVTSASADRTIASATLRTPRRSALPSPPTIACILNDSRSALLLAEEAVDCHDRSRTCFTTARLASSLTALRFACRCLGVLVA